MANEVALFEDINRSGIKPYAILPDDKRYKHKVQIRSSSSNRLYTVSWDTATSKWKCGCASGIARGYCQHLTAMIPALERAYKPQPAKVR